MANGGANSHHARLAAEKYRANFAQLSTDQQGYIKEHFKGAGKTRNWESTYGALEYMRGINLPKFTVGQWVTYEYAGKLAVGRIKFALTPHDFFVTDWGVVRHHAQLADASLIYDQPATLPESALNENLTPPDGCDGQKNEGSATLSIMVYESITQIPKGATAAMVVYSGCEGGVLMTPIDVAKSDRDVETPTRGYAYQFDKWRYPAASWGWS